MVERESCYFGLIVIVPQDTYKDYFQFSFLFQNLMSISPILLHGTTNGILGLLNFGRATSSVSWKKIRRRVMAKANAQVLRIFVILALVVEYFQWSNPSNAILSLNAVRLASCKPIA